MVFPLKQLSYFINIPLLTGTDKKAGIPAPFIDLPQLFHLFLFSDIFFVETEDHRDLLDLHHHQEPVQKIEMGRRLCHCEYHQRLVYIGGRRTDQFILPGQDLHDVPGLLRLIQHLDLYIVSHQGLDLLLAEDPLGLAFINTGSCYVHVVESGNSFYDLTLHNLVLLFFVLTVRSFLIISGTS